MVKKILLTVLILSLFIGTFLACSYYEHNYKKDGTVSVIYHTEHRMMIEDSQGNEWYTEYDDVSSVGDKVIITIFDNCTDTNINDDVVRKVSRK